MVKKHGFTCLFTASTSFSSPSSTPLPSCKQQKAAHSFMTMNSTYFDSTDSCRFTNSSTTGSESFSTASESSGSDAVVEAVIRGLGSADRLFFEPGCTNSIMEIKSRRADPVDPFEGGVAMTVDSEDLYSDFRRSMEEMIMAHGVKGWDWLEEMLGWNYQSLEQG
ncbi:Transcription repressor OFP13 [Ananas comosus]|uniref:Transcription repressor n=1 Tax=Ananas comosus TaxID=4615 RepID=A0A199V268_ANACO|nr:Transcription repressor OFP13 [Ananas comosus]